MRLFRIALLASLMSCASAAEDITTVDGARTFMRPLLQNCPGKADLRTELKNCLNRGMPAEVCQFELTESATGDQLRETNENAAAAYRPDQPKLKQAADLARNLVEDVVTDLPIPALNGTVDNFTGTLLPALMQVSDQLAEPQTLGVSLNLPRFLYTRVRLGGFATPEAELNPALEAVLVERGQLGNFREREKSLDTGDDYYLTADVSVLGPWFGRDLTDHYKAQSRLTRTAIAGRDLKGGDFESQSYLSAAAVLLNARDASDLEMEMASCALDLYNRVSRQDREREADAYLGDFWRLVHNQPQLTFSLRRLHRDEIVGADIESYRVKFSTGLFNNLTFLKLLSDCDRKLGGDNCANRYKDMVNGFAADYGLGFGAYYEWGRLADVSVALPPLSQNTLEPLLPPVLSQQLVDENNVFRLDGGDYRRYGWSAGATLLQPKPEDGNNRSSLRLDGGVDYYRYDRDPVRVDHEVARLTLTYRRGSFSFPFHLMYRSKSEFEADLGDDVVLGVGLQSSFSQW